MIKPLQIENLKKEIGDNLVIVEGKNDKKVLLKFGVKNILDISGKPLNEILEKVKYNSVIILTDFDKEGKKKGAYFDEIISIKWN